MDYKSLFSKSLNANPGSLFFQAHSHHLWPDIAFEGMNQYWQDSTELVDKKWEKIFNEILPKARSILKDFLHIQDSNQIVFAQNSHELIYRFFSSFDKPQKILTTNSEFYSLSRQLKRLEESNWEVIYLKTDHLSSNEIKNLIIKNAELHNPDILIFSHCFFNSGQFIQMKDLESIVFSLDPKTKILIDCYHSIFTRPLSFYHIAQKAYIAGGGYKYAMAGEGACFLISPPDCNLRPVYTGWMSEIDKLDNYQNDKLYYPDNANRFMGSTFEPSGLYRFIYVWDYLTSQGITFEKIHSYVIEMQNLFLKYFKDSTFFKDAKILGNNKNQHAHFFSIKYDNFESAEFAFNVITKKKIKIDKRGNILRFGFSIYQDENDIKEIFERLNS